MLPCISVNNYAAYFGDGTKLTVLEPDLDVTVPTVKVLRPSLNECKDKKDKTKRRKTLVCVASGFYPDHVQVSWQINGVNVTPGKDEVIGVATDEAALRDREDKFYSITSRLRVSGNKWYKPDNVFTCTVSFYDGKETRDFSDSVSGDKGKEVDMTNERYKTSAQTVKLTYFIFIAKSSFYGLFVVVLMWRLQGSSGKQCN